MEVPTDTIDVRELFPLNSLTHHLAGYRPPAEPHDPGGEWTLGYRVFTLAGRGGSMGSLQIHRHRVSQQGFTLDVRLDTVLSGECRQQLTAEMLCRSDALSTPIRWQFNSDTNARGTGLPVRTPRLVKSAAVEGRYVELTEGESKRRLPLPSAYTVNWALFDAVQRLPREPSEPLSFDLFDHFDQIKRDQRLSYRGAFAVRLPQRPALKPRRQQAQKVNAPAGRNSANVVKLHAFDHLGRGIVPWVYWVDETGRLLFAVSGLEAYVLETPAWSA